MSYRYEQEVNCYVCGKIHNMLLERNPHDWDFICQNIPNETPTHYTMDMAFYGNVDRCCIHSMYLAVVRCEREYAVDRLLELKAKLKDKEKEIHAILVVSREEIVKAKKGDN